MSALPVPGILMGAYPERRARAEPAYVQALRGARSLLTGLCASRPARLQAFLREVKACEASLGVDRPEEALPAVRLALAREGLSERNIAHAFAVVKALAARTLGLDLYDTQLIAARVMLDGRLAEMATGEGKTVAAGVCAATAALARIPVHVVTANDYLVARDAETLEPLFRALGLSVGSVTQDADPDARRAAYACDVTYCTAKELVFDYLRDRLAREKLRSDLHLRAECLAAGGAGGGPTLLRGLCMAIVDEADSILLDEARVPLILSEARPNAASEHFRQALAIASALEAGLHFRLDRVSMAAELTESGRAVVEARVATIGGAWRNCRQRDEVVCTALAALHLYERDRHYLVEDGAIAIVDENTGRTAPGRMWSGGLHQLVACKEGQEPGVELVTVAQITYQRFFRRYLRLCGMSGTLAEARAELAAVYGLPITRVPLRKPCRRQVFPTRVFPDADALWRAVVERAASVSASGRPVLIGTDSVLESETLSQRLHEAGIAHAVLNARHDRAEAQIVAQAGAAGQITVATNMAGRGTDIPLAPEVVARGGLHLICCQHNGSRRIDRQLLGRCARGGDPGSAETMLSLNKPLISQSFPAWARRGIAQQGTVLPSWAAALALRLPQWLEERRQRRARRALLQQDTQAESRSLIGRTVE